MKTIKEMIEHAVEASVKSLQREATYFDKKQVREFVREIKNLKPFDISAIHTLENSHTFIMNEVHDLEVVYERDVRKSKFLYNLKRRMRHILFHIQELEFLTDLEKWYNNDKSVLEYNITEEKWKELNNNLVLAYELLSHDDLELVYEKEYMIELFKEFANHYDDKRLISCLLNSLDLVNFLAQAEYLFGYNDKNILPDDIKKKTIYQTPQVLLSVLNPHDNLLKEMMLTERSPLPYTRESAIVTLDLAIRNHISSIRSAFNMLEHHRVDLEKVKPSWKNSKEMFDKLDEDGLDFTKETGRSTIELHLPSRLKDIVLYMSILKQDLCIDTYSILAEDEGDRKLNLLLSHRLRKQTSDRIQYIITLAMTAGFLAIVSGRLRAKGHEDDTLLINGKEVDMNTVIDKEAAIKILNARRAIFSPEFKDYACESKHTKYYYPYSGYVAHTHKALITLADLEIVRIALMEAIEVFGYDLHYMGLYMLDANIVDPDYRPLIKYYASIYDECSEYISEAIDSYDKRLIDFE